MARRVDGGVPRAGPARCRSRPIAIIDRQDQRGSRSPRRARSCFTKGAGKARSAAAPAGRGQGRRAVTPSRPASASSSVGKTRTRDRMSPGTSAAVLLRVPERQASGIDSEHRRHCRGAAL